MNGYDRYFKIIKGESADILPRLPILMAFAAKFIGSNYGAFASNYQVLVEANIKCIEYFDFDQVSAISDPFRETQGFGAEIEFIRDGVPKCIAPPLEKSYDLSLLKRPDPYSSERMLDRIKAIERFKNLVYKQYSIMGWIEGPAAEAADLRGVTNFLMDLVMEPDFANELMQICVDVGIEFASAQLKAGADTIGIGDAIASQVSPNMYRDLIFQHEKRLIDSIHELGGIVRLHICGDTSHLLPFFSQLGADIIDLDWQVDMKSARNILGPNIVIVGNLDPVNSVMKSSPEKIEAEIRQIYMDIGNPYMVGAGCEIPQNTPYENLKALCKPINYVKEKQN
ncbi:MAG: uroporphyrinogen decarboxylase family protein [bacterium]